MLRMISPSSLSAFSVAQPAATPSHAGATAGTRQYARVPGGPPSPDPASPKAVPQQAAPSGTTATPLRLLPRGSLVDLSA